MRTSSAALPVLRFSVPLLFVVTGLCLWSAWCQFPFFPWNDARLAPAFALRLGINPYPLIGGGPLSTWIYGPVGIFINLPATWAASAEDALHIASLINFSVLTCPLVVIFFTATALGNQVPELKWFALALSILLIPAPNFIFQVADHTAVAFGLLSNWWLAKPSNLRHGHYAIAAAFCSLAIWSKQITVFLVAAQLVYLFQVGQRAAIVKYLLWLALWGFIALGLFVWSFGWENLWLNLVVIPERLPWADDFFARLIRRRWPLIAQIGLPIIGLTVLRMKKIWPGSKTDGGRFFQLSAMAYATMLPIGLMGFAKIGGDTNLIHSWDYLLPGSILVWLESAIFSPATGIRMIAAAMLAVCVHFTDLLALPSKPLTRHFEYASRLAAAYPHEVWFPRNPVITYYADGKLWQSEDGIQTRFLAHYGLREADFRRYLPPNLKAVAYPAQFGDSFSMALLSELSQTSAVPDWTIYSRPMISQGTPKK